eukprot:COSAG02_NODE_2003_length_10135_cov_9.873754_11_plen_401_part_00
MSPASLPHAAGFRCNSRVRVNPRRLFVANGTEPLYSMRKLQDWTSNQLYRWRLALKKGQKPPSPALRKHIASTGASEESVVAAATALRSKPVPVPAAGVASVGRKPRCRSAQRNTPEAKDAKLRVEAKDAKLCVKPTIEKKAAGRAEKKRKKNKPDPTAQETVAQQPTQKPAAPTQEPAAAAQEVDALSREVSITTALQTVMLPEFCEEEMQDMAICQVLGRTDAEWVAQRQETAEKQTDPGTSTPVSVIAPVSTPVLIPEEPPVQDVEQLLFMEERSDAAGHPSPVWESEGGNDVSSPEGEANRQPLMITEPLSFVKADSERAPLTPLTSWSVLDSLSNNMNLVEPSVPVTPETCETSKDVDDPAFSNALSEWGSTTLTRQRSWGAPLQPFPNSDIVVE